MSAPSAHPDLYEVDESGRPTLIGLRDSGGSVSFPFQTHGSEHNGDVGEQLSRIPLAGTGTVSAVVDVHLPLDPALEVPYRLASVVLDEGDRPVVRLRMPKVRKGKYVLLVRYAGDDLVDGADPVRTTLRVRRR